MEEMAQPSRPGVAVVGSYNDRNPRESNAKSVLLDFSSFQCFHLISVFFPNNTLINHSSLLRNACRKLTLEYSKKASKTYACRLQHREPTFCTVD
ncbi:unnamed protein product [Sphenostylis stenocarpa]|uniref:Uncharacterized protein n=1 Tax=Sphenostylis stenocarpa TaxID=92480 RepID=A0AA86TEP8_9FABA|nr:unnamed protein product [Sphenostylis stenocarpa]